MTIPQRRFRWWFGAKKAKNYHGLEYQRIYILLDCFGYHIFVEFCNTIIRIISWWCLIWKISLNYLCSRKLVVKYSLQCWSSTSWLARILLLIRNHPKLKWLVNFDKHMLLSESSSYRCGLDHYPLRISWNFHFIGKVWNIIVYWLQCQYKETIGGEFRYSHILRHQNSFYFSQNDFFTYYWTLYLDGEST